MSCASVNIGAVIDKLGSADKDLRYMAVSDLYNELQNEAFSVPAVTEAKLCEQILLKTEDASSDVCSLAIKCLSPLLARCSEANGREIVRHLCNAQQNKTTTKSKSSGQGSNAAVFRSISLKTLIAGVKQGESKSSRVLVEESVPKMLQVLQTVKDNDALGESLDILHEMIKKFGFFHWSDQVDLINSLLELFSRANASSRDVLVRKKCILCLSALANHLDAGLLEKVLRTCINAFTGQMPKAHTLSQQQSAQLKSQVTCVSSLVASVGDKQGLLLSESIPTLIGLCEQDEDEQEECDELESLFELREACIHCFESFVKHVKGFEACEKYVKVFIDLCMKYTCYDPNFAYDEDEDSAEDMEIDENGGDDFEESDYEDDYDDGVYSDDDDTSWKVRKAAANCLVAILHAYPQALNTILEASFNTLVQRLKERDEGVKCEILSTLQSFLAKFSEQNSSLDKQTREKCAAIINGKVGKLVKSSLKELGSASSRIKFCYISLLKELVGAPDVHIFQYASDLLKKVQSLINDKNLETNLKVEIFLLLRDLLRLSDDNAYNTKSLKELLSTLLASVDEKSFKVSAEAFRTLFRALEIIYKRWDTMYENVIVDIYDTAFVQMTSTDIDQDVREESITCMGLLLSLFPSHLPGRSDKAIQAIFDRAKSEATRITAVKTLAKIASSGQIDLSCVSGKLERELATYLKKANHTLRVSALTALSTLVETKQLSSDIDCAVENASNLIHDDDIPLASTAMHMMCKLIANYPVSLPYIETFAKPEVLGLIQSPLVQGGLVTPLQSFFSMLTKAQPSCSEELLLSIETIGLGEHVKQNVRKTAAKCIASICHAVEGNKCVDYSNKSIELISKDQVPDHRAVLSLLCLAEIGRESNLSGCDGIDSTILNCFESSSEDVRGTAAYALGRVAAQSLDFFLPKIFDHMESHLKLRYLLLLSLKEIIASAQSVSQQQSMLTESHFSSIQNALFRYCETEEEAIRIMCAECLGHMELLKPAVVIASLVEYLESEQPNVREVAVSAFRDAANDEQLAIKAKDVFESAIPHFLHKMSDPELKVKRAAVLLLNVLLHYHLDAIRPFLSEMLALLYKGTEFKKESLREVMLGPFKQIVDDSLIVRRAAYECMHTAVNRCFENIQPEADAFLDLIISGLADHYDISKTSHLSLADHYSLKMTCYGILAKLCELHPSGCVSKADLILPPLYKTLIYKLKSDAVKQEQERLEEVQLACMRCVKSISRVAGMKDTEMFGKLMISFNKNPDLLSKFKA